MNHSLEPRFCSGCVAHWLGLMGWATIGIVQTGCRARNCARVRQVTLNVNKRNRFMYLWNATAAVRVYLGSKWYGLAQFKSDVLCYKPGGRRDLHKELTAGNSFIVKIWFSIFIEYDISISWQLFVKSLYVGSSFWQWQWMTMKIILLSWITSIRYNDSSK